MKNNIPFGVCLVLAYSSSVCSEFDQNFTRRHYMYPNGETGTITMNEGSRNLYNAHPELFVAMLNDTEQAARRSHASFSSARANATRQNTTTPDATQQSHSSRSYPTVMPQFAREEVYSAPVVEEKTQAPQETQHAQAPNVYGDSNCRGENEEALAAQAFINSIRANRIPENVDYEQRPEAKRSMPLEQPTHPRKRHRHSTPNESSDSDDENSDDAQEPLPFKTMDLSKASCKQALTDCCRRQLCCCRAHPRDSWRLRICCWLYTKKS